MMMLLCCYSCATRNNLETPQDPIIGKWKLVKIDIPRPPASYTTDDLILEFRPNDILTVQCLQQNNNCRPWNDGNYRYSYIDSDYGTMIQIDNTRWWYSVSGKKLMIGQGPVDGVSYFFEKM